MLLKYRTPTGQEVTIHTEQELSMAMRTQRITPATPVQLPGYRSWVEAGSLPDFAAWEEVAISYAAVAAAPVAARVAAPAQATLPGMSERKLTWFWLGVGMIFGGTIVGLGAFYFALEPLTMQDLFLVSLGMMAILGRGLGVAVVLGLLVALILRGPTSRHLWLMVPILGIAIFGQSLSSMSRVIKEHQEQQPALQEMTGPMESMMAGGGAGGVDARTPLGQLIQAHALRIEQVHKALQANIDEHGLADMLTPTTLGDDAAVAKAEANIKAWDSRLYELEQRYYDAFDQTEKEMESLPQGIREGVLAGYRKSYAETREQFAAFFQVEHDFARAVVELFQFMRQVHSGTGVEVKGEELHFSGTGQAEDFNRLMESIDAVVQREAELQQQMRTNAEQVLQRLRELQN